MDRAITSAMLKESLCKAFPPDATSWAQATDELRDMARQLREQAGLDASWSVEFRNTTPGEWNRKAIIGILAYFSLLSDYDQCMFVVQWSSVLR